MEKRRIENKKYPKLDFLYLQNENIEAKRFDKSTKTDIEEYMDLKKTEGVSESGIYFIVVNKEYLIDSIDSFNDTKHFASA